MRAVLLSLMGVVLVHTGCGKESSGGGDVEGMKDIPPERGEEGFSDQGGESDAAGTKDAAFSLDVFGEGVDGGFDTADLVSDLPGDVVETDTAAQVCLPVEVSPGEYLGGKPVFEYTGQGVTADEMDAFDTLASALLAVPSILFVDTFLVEEDQYLIRFAGGSIRFVRSIGVAGPEFQVVQQEGVVPFNCITSDGLNTYESELAAGSNPLNTDYTDLGYAPGDERVSFIEPEDHCFPFPFLRISQLYDSPNAPDFHYSFTPYGVPEVGSHGALDVLQSRAPLVISGKGIRKGINGKAMPMLVDIAPTVLYLMGAEPSPGLRHGVQHTSTWLAWQDGEVLTGLLEPGCVEPFRYAFIFLFDGLASNELLHHFETKDLDLPAFYQVMEEGMVYQNGAIAGLPTVSAPGHLSVGTGMLNGHHGFLANGFYLRDKEQVVSPGEVLANQDTYVKNPDLALELYNDIFNPLGETIFEAAHRHFEDIYTASVNELTLPGADYSLVTFLKGEGYRGDYFELADNLVNVQLNTIIDKHWKDERMLVYVSFYSTDHAGEASGPHSDMLREKLVKLDAKLGLALKKLHEKGIADQSLIVLTADHGMELQDKNRTYSWTSAMEATGISYIDPDGFGMVYLTQGAK